MKVVLFVLLLFAMSFPSVSVADDGTTTKHQAAPLLFVSSFAGGREGGIHAYRLDPGKGTLSATASRDGIDNPFFMALSPDRKYLYAVHAEKFGGKDNEEVAAYAIIDGEGRLDLLNRRDSRGTATCYLDVDARGSALLLANYSTGNVASLPIKPDGSLGEAVSVVQHEGSSINAKRQQGPFAHSIVVSPDSRYAYAADLGVDKVFCYTLDAGRAEIVAHADQPFVELAPGSGPRHLCFHPDGGHLYVINELLNTITVFDYAAETGRLLEKQTIATLPGGYDEITHTADLKITPDGRFLYGTNRGHDSIACYRIDDGGRLSLIEIVPSLGKGPQNLAIAAGGRWLLCANMPGGNVAVFAIDPESGKLTSAGQPLQVLKPACLMLLE